MILSTLMSALMVAAVHAATHTAEAIAMTTAANTIIHAATATAAAMGATADLGGGPRTNANMDTIESMTSPTNTRDHALMSTRTVTKTKTFVTAERLDWSHQKPCLERAIMK